MSGKRISAPRKGRPCPQSLSTWQALCCGDSQKDSSRRSSRSLGSLVLQKAPPRLLGDLRMCRGAGHRSRQPGKGMVGSTNDECREAVQRKSERQDTGDSRVASGSFSEGLKQKHFEESEPQSSASRTEADWRNPALRIKGAGTGGVISPKAPCFICEESEAWDGEVPGCRSLLRVHRRIASGDNNTGDRPEGIYSPGFRTSKKGWMCIVLAKGKAK